MKEGFKKTLQSIGSYIITVPILVGAMNLFSGKTENPNKNIQVPQTQYEEQISPQNRGTYNAIMNGQYGDTRFAKAQKEMREQKGILFPDLNINSFNPGIWDKQKQVIYDFLMQTKITKDSIVQYVDLKDRSKILDGDNFRFDIINKNLALILQKLSREENINLRLVLAIYHKESLQGKNLRINSGARWPLQSMPNTIKENCSEFRNQFKSEKEFLSDLFIQTRAGLK